MWFYLYDELCERLSDDLKQLRGILPRLQTETCDQPAGHSGHEATDHLQRQQDQN